MTKIGISQNGWAVYDTTAPFVRTSVEGVGFWSANADVAYLLDDFTQWYHDTIEHITLPVSEAPGYDDWSWAVRAVRGQTEGYSNHGSCTARDLNATRHPRGVKGTHSPKERDLIRAKIATYGGVLRHGEFYTGTVDGMHVEINANKEAVARVAAALRAEEDDMAGPTIGEIRAVIREELTRDQTVKVLAEKLFSADVIEAPGDDLVAHPENPKWQLRTYLNRLVNNTKKDAPPAP